MVPLPNARRLPAAILIALVVGASVGTAFAAGTERQGEPPSQIQLPPFRLGDRGAYTLSLEGNWSEVDGTRLPEAPYKEPRTAIIFEWSNAGKGQDGSGATGPADLLRVQTTEWDLNIFSDSQPWTLVNKTKEVYFRSGETQPYMTTGESQREGFTDPNTLLNVSLPGDRFGSSSHSVTDHYREPQLHCIVNLDFAGRTVPAEGILTVPARPCESGQAWYAPFLTDWGFGETQWRAKGWVDIDGGQLLHLEEHDSITINGERASVWLHPGIPVPVRYEVRAALEGKETVARYDLTSFQTGKVERVSRGAWIGGWSDPATSSRPTWGIDDSGLQLPFPAQDAFQRMGQNKTWSDFVRSNPDAYVFRASATNAELYGHSMHIWDFSISNGTAAVHGQVRQVVPAALESLPREAWEPTASYEVAAERAEEKEYFGIPPRASLPLRLPTAKAAEERWVQAGGTGGANWAGFGFRYDILQDEWHPYVGAGWQRVRHHLADEDMASPEGIYKFNSLNSTTDIAFIEAKGNLISRQRHTWDTSDPDPLRIESMGPVPKQ